MWELQHKVRTLVSSMLARRATGTPRFREVPPPTGCPRCSVQMTGRSA